MASKYNVRVVHNSAEGVPGAVFVEDESTGERWHFGTYNHFWSEVGGLENEGNVNGVGGDHASRLKQYQSEYDAAGGDMLYNLIEPLKQKPQNFPMLKALHDRVGSFQSYMAMLKQVTSTVANEHETAAKYTVIHGYNGFHELNGVVVARDPSPAGAHRNLQESAKEVR